MQTVYIGENAIHFFKKGIAFSLLIFAGLTAHANPSYTETSYSKGKIYSSSTDCTYTLSAMNHSVGANPGANVAVTVTVIGTGCTWTAAVEPNVRWITITSGASGTGNGTVTYSYKANMAAEERMATVTIADKTYTVTQAGRPLESDGYEPNNSPETAYLLAANFSPSLEPNAAASIDISPATSHINNDVDYYKINLGTEHTYTFSGALYNSGNQINNSNYTLRCQISYSTNGTYWIWANNNGQLLPATVPGGTLYLKVVPYADETGSYAAKIEITAGCRALLPVLRKTVSSAAGSAQITTTTGSSCPSSSWTAASNAGWLTLTTSIGTGHISYSYAANTTADSRTGEITVGSQTYTVTQEPSPDSHEPNNTMAQATLLAPTFEQNASAIRILRVNCHKTSDVDYYKIALENGYTHILSGTLYDRYNQNEGSNYTLGGNMSYSADNGANWIEANDGRQLLPAIVPGGTLYLKIEPRWGYQVGTYGVKIEIKRAAAVGCTYTLSPNKQATQEAGSDQVTVTTSAPSCIWSAVSTVGWITLASGASHHDAGNGSATYSYRANMATMPRTGRIIVAGQDYTVTQEGRPLVSDGYEPNNEWAQASSFSPEFIQNVGAVDISQASCHPAGDVDYYKIELETGYSYSFSGALYDLYNQKEGSNYTLDAQISYSTNGIDWSRPEDRQLRSETASGRTLYLKIEPKTSGGAGTYGAKIEIKRVAAIGCTYSLSAVSKRATMQAGSDQIAVTATGASSCFWAAFSNDGWITITSGASAAVSGNVGYSYTENTSSSVRRGRITIAGQTCTVIQAGRSLPPDSYEPNDSPGAAYLLEANFSPSLQPNAIASIDISPANCHEPSDFDYYKINLPSEYTYTLSGALYNRRNQNEGSDYTLVGYMSYSTNGYSWIEVGSNAQLLPATVSGRTLYLKIVPYADETGSYAAKIEITAGCHALLPVLSKTVPSAAGSDQITVTTGSSCPPPSWATASNADWLTFAGGARTATGTGNIGYSYAANTTEDLRTGTITIADKIYTVTQAPPPDRYEPNNTAEQASPLTPTFNQNESVIHISQVNCHEARDADIYKINLEANYTYAISGNLYRAQNDGNRNYTLNPNIYSSTNEGFSWSIWGGRGNSSLPEKTVQGGHPFYLKIEPSGQGTGTYAAQINISRTAACTYDLSERRKEVSSDAGAAAVTVTAGSSCNASHSWGAASNDSWITLASSESKTGSGSVAYSYGKNTQWGSREGTITIAGQAYTVTQMPPPITPDRYEPNNTAAQATPLTATSAQNASVFHISSVNCHETNDADIYKIELETGYTYTFSGAFYSASKPNEDRHYTLIGNMSYSTNGVDWSDEVNRELLHATVPGGTLYLKIEPHWGGQVGTYAAKIEIRIAAAAGCSYTLSPDKRATREEGSDRVTVRTSAPSCIWSAVSNADWITLASGASRHDAGEGSVAYSYRANMAPEPRAGRIAIAGKTYTVAQPGRPLAADRYEPNNTASQARLLTPAFAQNVGTVNISPASCHPAGDVDYYKIELETGYSYSFSGDLYDLYNQNEGSNYTLYAKISYSINDADWSIPDTRELRPRTVSGGTLYLKIEPYSSEHKGTYEAKIEIKRVAAIGCAYSLSAVSKRATMQAGSDQIAVTATGASSCFWAAESDVEWITITSGASATVSGNVGYSYTENTSYSVRRGRITIAGQTCTVIQAGRPLPPDSYEPNDSPGAAYLLEANFSPSLQPNAIASIDISPANCHETSDADYYKINLGPEYTYTFRGELYKKHNQNEDSNYTLEGNIFYSTNGVDWSGPYEGRFPPATMREGTLYLKIAPYTEEEGTYAAKIEITADCRAFLPVLSKTARSAAGSDQITVTTGSSCPPPSWTALSNADWLTFTATGTRNAADTGNIGYSYAANTTADSRTGTITVGAQTYTVTQAPPPPAPDSYEPNNTTAETAQPNSPSSFTPEFNQNASAIDISTANCHVADDADIYKINLADDYVYAISGVLYDLSNPQNGNLYTLRAKIACSTDGGVTWSNLNNRRFSNLSAQGGHPFYLKIEPSGSGQGAGIGTYAARININRTFSCIYALSERRKQASSDAGSATVTVTASSSCVNPWRVTSDDSWITLMPRENTAGSGSVVYSYEENTTLLSRTGIITIAGETYTVIQMPPPITPDRYEPNNTTALATPLTATSAQNASVFQISSANCHETSDADIYKIELETGYTYRLSGALYDRGNQINNSNYTIDAEISYSTDNGAHWSYPGSTGLSPATVSGGTLYLKINPWFNRDVGSYGAKIDIKAVAAAGCTYTLSPDKQATQEEGSGQVTVTTSAPSCIWSAVSNADWITLASGTNRTEGEGSVAYSYRANMAPEPRTGHIIVAGKAYAVNQPGHPLAADRYEDNNTASQAHLLTPTFAQNVGTADISQASCHLAGDVDYYKIELGTEYAYRLSGAIYNSYNQNEGSNYTLYAKISYSINNTNWNNLIGSQLHFSAASGGTLYLKIEPYFGWGTGTYAAKIEIRRLTAIGCAYSLSAVSKRAAMQEGSDQVTVTATGSSCFWSAISNVDWITITSDAHAVASGNVGYSYTENTSSSVRMGTITIAGETYTVTQAGRPIPPDSYEPNNTPAQASLLHATFTQNASVIHISSANCHDASDVDIYKINLPPEHTYTFRSALYNRYNQRDGSNYTLSGNISYSTNGADWSTPFDRELPSATALGGTLYLKIQPHGEGAGTYAARIDIRAGCRAFLPVLSKTVTSATGSDEIAATAGSSCASASWTAVSNADWLTFTGGARNATGTGNIGYSYAANTTTDLRTGTITVGGHIYTVTQAPPPDRYEPNNTTAETAQPNSPSSFTPEFNQNASVIHISPANCHAADDADIYKINLEAGYTYAISSELYSLFNPQNNNRYTLHAKITYSTDDGATWNEAYSGPLPNLSVQGGHPFYLKIESFSSPEQKMGTYAAQININRTVACTYALSERSKRVTSDAGSVTVTVTASSSCNASHSWAAASNAWWLTTEPSESKTGSGHAVYSYPANTTLSSRTGTITIAGHAYTVIQEGLTLAADGYEPNNELAQASLLTPEFIQNVGVANILQANCHLENDVDYYKIELETGYTYTLSGALYDSDNQINNSRYTLDAEISYSTDNGANWSRREDIRLSPATVPGGTLYLKIKPYSNNGGTGTYAAKIEIRHGACVYAFSPASGVASAAGGPGEATVTTTCAWTAASDAEWITNVSPAFGIGNATVTYSVAANTGAERTGTLSIGGKPYIVKQAGTVTGFETVSPVKIYPNPAKDFVTIDWTENGVKCIPVEIASVKIANQFGQILYEIKNPVRMVQIPLKGFAAGLYFILLQEEEKTAVQKLVIND